MFKQINLSAPTSLASAVVALLAGSTPAAAVADPPSFKEVWIRDNSTTSSYATFHVLSDGEQWTEVKPEKLRVPVKVKVQMKRGYIEAVVVAIPAVTDDHLKYDGNEVDSDRDVLYSHALHGKLARKLEDSAFLDQDTSTMPNETTRAIDACNNLGVDPSERRETWIPIEVGIGARGYRTTYYAVKHRNTRDHAWVQAKVICEAGPVRTSGIEAPPEPYSVDVKVEQNGNSCPKKTDVTAIIKYRRPFTARFRFKVDGKPSEPITIKARKVESGKPGAPGGPGAGTYWLIERLKTYHLDPGQHNFRVELDSGEGAKSGVKTVKIDCPPFKVVSTSLNYKVAKQPTCPKNVKETVTATATRPGKAAFVIKTAGGLTVHSGTAEFKRKGMSYVAKIKRHNLMMSEFDSDMMADFTDYAANSGWVHLGIDCLEALSGKLTLNSLGATACKGEALVAIHTNGTGKLPYELECGPGKSWQRKVTAMDNKIGVDKVRFDVTNNEQVTCVLRTRIGGELKSLDGASKTFQCHKPTDAGASNDFVPETRPDAQDPDKPGKVVIDPPRPPNGPRQPGKVVIDPPRSPKGPTLDDVVVTGTKTEMSCSGGTVRNEECLCPRTHKAVPAGKNAFRCVKSVVIDPVKPGGKDSGATDATPDYPKKTRADAEADRRRLEALKKKREEEARKKAEAERKREAAKKAAEARRKREAAKKAAEARRKREAAKKAAEARRKRQEAQKKAQEARKKRAEMAKKAAQRRKNGGSRSARVR